MDTELMQIPYAVHEGDMARMERANRRLWVLCLVMFLALVITNAGWIWYESQWMEVEQEVSQDVDTGDGDAVVVGIGDVGYGEGKANGKNEEASP